MATSVEPLRKPVRIVTPEGIKRRCARCKQYKLVDEFRYRKCTRSYISYCNPCEKEYNREYRKKNAASIKAYQSAKAKQRWQEIKSDPERHAQYLEDIRIERRLQNKNTKMRRGLFYQKDSHRYVDPDPLVQHVRSVLTKMTMEELARLCDFDHANIRELLNHAKRVSFYKADRICTATGVSVYTLYPEERDAA